MKIAGTYQKSIKKILISSILFSIGLGLLLYGLLKTQLGLTLAFYAGASFVPGKIKVEKISGNLFESVLIQGLEYQHDQVTIKVEKLNLACEWWSIIKKDLNVEEFLIENAIVNFGPPAKNNLKDILNITQAKGNLNCSASENRCLIKLATLLGSYQEQPLQMEASLHFDKNLIYCGPCRFAWGPHTLVLNPTLSSAEITENAVPAPSKLQWQYHGRLDNTASVSKKSDYWGHPIHIQGEVTCLPGQIIFQNSQLKVSNKNTAALKGHLNWNQGNVHGNIQIDIKDLSPIYHWLPSIARLKANPHITLDILGSFKKPQLKIQANLDRASFSIPKQRVNVKQFQLKIAGIFSEDLKIESAGIIAGNPFYVQGVWNPLKTGMPGKFQLRGNALRVMNTENIRIIASPNLALTYSDHNLAIQGDVNIIEGNIILKQELNSVIVSNDILYLEQDPNNVTFKAIYIQPEIQFILGDNLHFKGYGLDAKAGGKLYIEQRKDGLYTGQGKIILRDGKYRLPNGIGNIRRGYLYYPAGTLLQDPRIDIRVLQHSRDKLNEGGDVGVYVQGSLQKPIYNLYSSQSLKQNEILSKLGFGGTQFEGEDNQRKMLSQTAVLLGGGSNPLLENIQTKFGLEEFGIQSGNATKYIATQEGNDATLVVGKSLSDRFYLQFMQGMFVPSSTLKLHYFLTPNISISGETSTTGLGGDISFSVEKE